MAAEKIRVMAISKTSPDNEARKMPKNNSLRLTDDGNIPKKDKLVIIRNYFLIILWRRQDQINYKFVPALSQMITESEIAAVPVADGTAIRAHAGLRIVESGNRNLGGMP